MTMDYTEFYKTCYPQTPAFAQCRITAGTATDAVRDAFRMQYGRTYIRQRRARHRDMLTAELQTTCFQ